MSTVASPAGFVLIATLLFVVTMLLKALGRNAAAFAELAAAAVSGLFRTAGMMVVTVAVLLAVGVLVL